jgi:hypothetical protein
MTAKLIKTPESQGKFRKDIYETAIRIVRKISPEESPYRAFGESKSRGKTPENRQDKATAKILRKVSN